MLSGVVLDLCANLAPMQALDHSKVTDKDFAFLAGSWEADIWGGIFEESWSVPRAGTITHMGRHTSEGKTGFIEFSTIERDKEGRWTLFLLLGSPSKGDKKPSAFVLDKAAKGDMTFVNPANDYPTTIRYQGEGRDTMTATLSGKQKGVDQSDVFNFIRVKTGSSGRG